jgi:hypothetical protein
LAKHDWEVIYKQYLQAIKDTPALSMAEFARNNDLNVNSARRSLNKIKARLDNEGDRSPLKPDRSPKKNPAKKAPRKSKSPLKSVSNATQQEVNARAIVGIEQHEKDSRKVTDHFKAPTREQVTGSKVSTRGRKGKGVKHGAYMELAKINPDLVKAAILLNQDDGVTTLMSARYLQMRLTLSEMIEAIERDYGDNNPWKDENGNVIPKSKAYANALFGTSTAFTELEGKMDNAKLKREKLELDREKLDLEKHEAHPLTKVSQIERTKELLKYRAENELSAVDASYLFELEGLAVPRTLVAEADKEISLRQMVKEDLPEVTAEELDQMMLDYEVQKQEWSGDWLAEREAGIAELKTISASDEVEIIE